jgi:protease I
MTRSKTELSGRRVAILAADGYEPSELREPRKALEEAGALVSVISLQAGTIRGKGEEAGVTVDGVVAEAREDDFDALVLPGGLKNPDTLRQDAGAVDFVRAFFAAGKPIGAICHGPWLLVEADVVRGRRVTSYPSIRTDLRNAGADWVDEAVVVDKGLVTSRTPDDLVAFNARLVEVIARG